MKESPGLRKAVLVHEWMENNLHIRTKAKTVVSTKKGKKKRTQLVPFRLNAIQFEYFAQYVAYCWHHELPVKVLEPKPRQIGSTTYWQALGFTLCVLDPGFHVITIAHIEKSATEIFGKTRTFMKNLPPRWRLPLASQQQNSIEWENGSHSWVAMAAQGDALGRGPTPSMIHFSEVASYADKGQDPLLPVTAVHGALADNPKQSDTIVVYESTAKGKDPLFWEECEVAKDPDSGSEYTLLFIAWFQDPTYSMTWEEYRRRFTLLGKRDPGPEFVPTEEERLLRRQLATANVRPEEITWRRRVDLTDEQLIWRRWAIRNTCKGKLHRFQREFPSTYEEAFSASIKCMFDRDTYQYYHSQIRDPEAVGELEMESGELKLSPCAHGKVTVWQGPRPSLDYVIGADVGGGEKRSDPCAAYVLNSHTLEVVAAFYGRVEWDTFVTELQKLGRFYNYALLCVENNHNPAVASTLHREGYPNLYYYSYEGRLKGSPNRPGFNTNRTTRPELISYIDSVTRSRRLQSWDAGFVREMEHFVFVEKEDRYRAVKPNHDDRIMAMALSVYVAQGRDADTPEQLDDVPVEFIRSRKLADFARRMREEREAEGVGILYL